MKDLAKANGSDSRLAHLLDSIRLSPREMSSAKARMDQAQSIANGITAVGTAIGAAIAWVLHASQAFARRIRSAFMKPAHD